MILFMNIKALIKHESFSGILLVFSIFLALLIDNSPLAWIYDALLTKPVVVKVGELGVDKPLLLWINDGLMAVFFLLVGLEIKKEILIGDLSSMKQASLPIIAAIGGIACPALIYAYFNISDPAAIDGWAIPAATDIAFALGILALLGDRIPKELKILLLSIAIIDDIAAIVIIAVFYTNNLSMLSLGLGLSGFAIAFALNRFKVKSITPYILIGIFMWICVLKSGVHATLAGVLLAFAIPMKGKTKTSKSPLIELEHDLYPWVYFAIMPIFAFANSGIHLWNFSFSTLLEPVSLGIILGLFAGKQIGVLGFIALGSLLHLCRKPKTISWAEIYGVAILTGIGFTMSLFIGSLAFDDPTLITQVRMSVLVASFLSAILGYIVLRHATNKVKT